MLLIDRWRETHRLGQVYNVCNGSITTSMALLRIDTLYDGAWRLFGFQFDQLVADRDQYLARLQHRLGHEMAEEIRQHVDISLGRTLAIPDRRNPEILTMREFDDLWQKEKTIEEVERRIEANAIFYDSDYGLLRILGLSWGQDVLRLLDGKTSPGYMPLKNVQKFLATVRSATQRIKGEDASDEDVVKFFRERRRELIQFLQRVLQVGEPLYCDL